jgi:hypothetical protein
VFHHACRKTCRTGTDAEISVHFPLSDDFVETPFISAPKRTQFAYQGKVTALNGHIAAIL